MATQPSTDSLWRLPTQKSSRDSPLRPNIVQFILSALDVLLRKMYLATQLFRFLPAASTRDL